MSSVTVLVSTFHPYPTLSFNLPEATPISRLPLILSPILSLHHQSLSSSNGKTIDTHSHGSLLSILQSQSNHRLHLPAPLLTLRLVPKVLGGKGGFGSQLRAAGGRMSSQKTQNNDSCRDLSGRRLSTIKEAQKLAAAIAAEPERQAAKRKEAEERLEGLKKEIERLDRLVNGTDEVNLKKRRLNDNHLLTQSKEGIEKVRNATAMAMLKKRKKNLKDSQPKPPSHTGPHHLAVVPEENHTQPCPPAHPEPATSPQVDESKPADPIPDVSPTDPTAADAT